MSGFNGTTSCEGDCNDLNGDWTLTYQGSCFWSTGDVSPCYSSAPTWQLSCDGTEWALETTCLAGAGVIRYTKSIASWSCLGSNTLTRVREDCCDSWPTTLTVVPV